MPRDRTNTVIPRNLIRSILRLMKPAVGYIAVKVVSSYIAQYPVLRTVQSALHFTSLVDLFNQTPSQLLWVSSSHMQQLMREGCTYSPLSIGRYSFIQLSELEQCRVQNMPKLLTQQHRIRTRVS